jgi:hypothetical protein
MKEESNEEIETWISETLGGSSWFMPDPESRDRICGAFKNVLSRLNEEDLERFVYNINPTIIHFGRWHNACVFTLYIPPNPSEEHKLTPVNVIYLSPDFDQDPDERLQDIIAHEIAHLFLGHPEKTNTLGDGDPEVKAAEIEMEADTLSTSWGFSPCYGPDGKKCGG